MSRVTDPEHTDPKQLVNEKLLKIKSELDGTRDDSDYDDDLENFSQAPRPQQFYQDLDTNLEGYPRDLYVTELLRLCCDEYSRLSDYRDRLAERARGFPECPDTRLVNRRNSSHATREKKCANDCYLLNAFLNGDRSKEIYEVFTNPQVPQNETIAIDDETDTYTATEFFKPDVYAILTHIQAEVTEIAKKQRTDSHVLNDLRSDIAQMTTTFRTFKATLNSIFSRTSTDTPATKQITKLQNDVSRLGSTLATMNKRFLDQQTDPVIDLVSSPRGNKEDNENPNKTYADVVVTERNTRSNANANPPEQNREAASVQTNTANEHDTLSESTSTKDQSCKTLEKETSTHHNNPLPSPSSSSAAIATTTTIRHMAKQTGTSDYAREVNYRKDTRNDEAPTNRFIAARRRKVTSYFVGNIDTSVDETDIWEYLREAGVKPTHLTMFYGKTGSSARINVHYGDEERFESDTFWPDGVTCRKWVSRTEWIKEREVRQRKRYETSRYRYNNRHRHRRDDDYDDNRYSDYEHSDRAPDQYTNHNSRNFWQGDEEEW